MKGIINIQQNVLSKNNQIADELKKEFTSKKIFVVNLMSSPGSGKTSILEKTLTAIKDSINVAVIEGDQQTSNDADRIAKVGVPVYQINTNNSCHLNAEHIRTAYDKLKTETKNIQILFIENVGNLICPSSYFLGENKKIVILSTTEGEDKPIKYPSMFSKCEIMIINKIDLLPYTDFNVDTCIGYAKQLNPSIEVFQLSARTLEGFESWINWLKSKI